MSISVRIFKFRMGIGIEKSDKFKFAELFHSRNRPPQIKEFTEMFESEFAKTEYIEKDGAVFHVWKKEAHFDDYRKPVIASLELLRDHKDSIFIVDARNGFEDVKEDVEWGFEYFLPELKKTGCRIWGFILPEVSDIEGEIDLWTSEIEKNFAVIRAVSYYDIIRKAKKPN